MGRAAVFASFGLCLSFLPLASLAEVVAYGLLVMVFGSPLIKFMSQSGCWPFVPNYLPTGPLFCLPLVGCVRGFWFSSICLPNSPLVSSFLLGFRWPEVVEFLLLCDLCVCCQKSLVSFLSLAFLLFSCLTLGSLLHMTTMQRSMLPEFCLRSTLARRVLILALCTWRLMS